jgi:hypothetical protein
MDSFSFFIRFTFCWSILSSFLLIVDGFVAGWGEEPKRCRAKGGQYVYVFNAPNVCIRKDAIIETKETK